MQKKKSDFNPVRHGILDPDTLPGREKSADQRKTRLMEILSAAVR